MLSFLIFVGDFHRFVQILCMIGVRWDLVLPVSRRRGSHWTFVLQEVLQHSICAHLIIEKRILISSVNLLRLVQKVFSLLVSRALKLVQQRVDFIVILQNFLKQFLLLILLIRFALQVKQVLRQQAPRLGLIVVDSLADSLFLRQVKWISNGTSFVIF